LIVAILYSVKSLLMKIHMLWGDVFG
jgi:hypothetical protein